MARIQRVYGRAEGHIRRDSRPKSFIPPECLEKLADRGISKLSSPSPERRAIMNSEVIFGLGWDLAYLYQIRAGDILDSETIGADRSPLKTLIDLPNLLAPFGLCESLLPGMRALADTLTTKYGKQPNMPLTLQDYSVINRMVNTTRGSLFHEISQRNLVEIGPTEGLLDYRKLLSSGVAALGDPNLTNQLPQIVKEDLGDAIKCLAFGLSTPAAMIALRATEGMLRQAVTVLTGTTGGEPWTEVLKTLTNYLHSAAIESNELSGYLTHLRKVRNSADHPEARFKLREAEDTFINAQYAIFALAGICYHHLKDKP
jgi:hypothetical protein